MEARVGTLAVGTRITTLLTGRSGVVRAQKVWVDSSTIDTVVEFAAGEVKGLHPDVRVGVGAPMTLTVAELIDLKAAKVEL